MEVFHHAAAVEPERIIRAGLFVVVDERQRNQVGAAIVGLEFSIHIQARLTLAPFHAFPVRPLDTTGLFDQVVTHAGNIQRALRAFRQDFHFLERTFRRVREFDFLAIGETLGQFGENPEIRFRFCARFHHRTDQVHAAFGIGEAAGFFRPHGGGQKHVRVLIGFHILIRILHYQEFQLLQRLANARRVGHRRHRIGGDQPQALDLAGFDGGKNVGHEHAALFREEGFLHAPEFSDFLAVLRFFQLAVTGQAGAGRPLARAHRIALAGDRQTGAAGLADVAGDQVQVVDAHHAIGTVGALVDAHGPDAHGVVRFRVQARHVANRVLVDAADARGSSGIVIPDAGFQRFDALGVRVDVLAVFQAFFQDHVHQRVLQHHVGARRDRQMNIGELREHGDAGVHHNQREFAFFQRFFQTPINHRMLFRQVGTPGDHAFGVLEIVVATGRAVRPERARITAHRRRHAQRGIAVVIVGADAAAHQLAQRVKLFRHDLAGGHDRKRITAVLALDALDLARHLVQRAVPVGRLPGIPRLVAHDRHTAASGRFK